MGRTPPRRPIAILYVTESTRIRGELSLRLVPADPTATPMFTALRAAGFEVGDRVAIVLADSLRVEPRGPYGKHV